MQQDNSSFWTDIKAFEERLAKSPDSFCFARLSEVYLKVGLIDDALHTARQGVAKHPGYISGQRALAMACHSKGLTNECLSALKRVAEAIPEDQLSQKLLGRISNDIGDRDAARLAFRTVLEFAPDDVECQLELESLERPSGVSASFVPSVEDDDEEIIEDLEILEELDIYEEESPEFESEFQKSTLELSAPDELQHDPLSTGTLAELYVSQGFIHKALDIYRTILADDPANSTVSARVSELERMGASAEAPVFDDEEYCEDESEDVPSQVPESSVIPVSAPFMVDAFPEMQAFSSDASRGLTDHKENSYVAPTNSVSTVLPARGIADNALSTLEGWLENIRRIRSCH
jgi:tetratricopeptide (TPR) repeat protein